MNSVYMGVWYPTENIIKQYNSILCCTLYHYSTCDFYKFHFGWMRSLHIRHFVRFQTAHKLCIAIRHFRNERKWNSFVSLLVPKSRVP